MVTNSLLSSRKIATGLAGLLVLSTVFVTLTGINPSVTSAAHTECSDGKDNDNDGKTDYPQDNDCESLDDGFEGVGLSGNFITLTDGKETVSPGGAVVYVITLKQQREDARVVNIDLHLPFQSNIVSASDGGAVSTDHIRWTNVSVYKNITRTLQVHANVNPNAALGQYLVARALVSGVEATDTTLVDSNVALPANMYSVSLTDGKEFAQPGDNLTYSIRVRNNGSVTGSADVRLGLPYDTYFLSNSDGGRRDSYTVTWPKVQLAPGEERVFTTTVQIDPLAHDRGAIRARAYAGNASDTDQTVVKVGLPYDAITASITDNRTTAQVGDLLNYHVTLRNSDDTTIGSNVAVSAAVPLYSEFVSATEGGYYDGTNVRWLVTQIAPNGTRNLMYTIRVRQDAKDGAVLTASVVADGITGITARDTTTVGNTTTVAQADRNVLFRKTADRSEAFPGGSIRYTLTVRNTLSATISDATIYDRYDSTYLSLQSFENPGSLVSQTAGSMEWKVPTLAPGETWTTSYILSVAANTPAGTDLTNVATIRGDDLDAISLTERVSTGRADTIRDFPATGAGMDAVLGLLFAAAAFGTAAAQKKMSMGL